MTDPTTQPDLDAIQAITARATADPFFLSDCEGSLQVWRESALVRVTRDEDGTINGYSFPFAYRPADQIIEIDLDSWDPGEDATDDQRRQDITDLVAARAALPALVAEIHRLRAELSAERAPFHLHSVTAIADADNPTQLRWGLDDVMWGDDDSVTVLLSGSNGEPYWLELDPERAAALRENLAGPDDEGVSGPCDCGEGAVHYTTADCPAAQHVASHCGARHYEHPETVCTEPTGHYQPTVDPHAGPLILDGRECGRAAWDEPTAARPAPTA